MVLIAIFIAIEILLAMTPLGFVPLGVTRATTIHIPVILGAIILGPKAGALLGGAFGLISILMNTYSPTITSFVFSPFYALGDFSGNGWSLVIALVPRILIGVTSYFTFKAVNKLNKNKVFAYMGAGIVGSLTNTIFVMSGIYLFFGRTYAAAKEMPFEALFGFIMTTIGINGIPEAIVAAILTAALGKTVIPIITKQIS